MYMYVYMYVAHVCCVLSLPLPTGSYNICDTCEMALCHKHVYITNIYIYIYIHNYVCTYICVYIQHTHLDVLSRS